MIFGSNPSVYTLPGTWEAQPFVPVELVFSTTVAVASLGLVVGLIAGISIVKIRRKRVSSYRVNFTFSQHGFACRKSNWFNFNFINV